MVKRRVRITKADRVKRTERIVLHTLDLSDLEGSLSDVSRAISELSEYDDNCDELILEIDEYYDYGGPGGRIVLIGLKQETDEEVEKRIEKLKETRRKEIKKQEAADEKLYKQLKKKYGDKWT